MIKPIYATWMISNNLGDALTPWLIDKITGQVPLYVPFDIEFPKYMVCGSVLNHAVDYTTVWGAGFANFDDIIHGKPIILAVRGPVTANRILLQYGISVPVIGDPALLMPRFYNPKNIEKKYKVGFIPHYVHQYETAEWLRGRDDIVVLNVFDSPEHFVDKMIQCEVVYSSSLHGLILADAYGVPRMWYNGTVQLGGDGAKFVDYFNLVHSSDKTPADHPHIHDLPTEIEELYKLAKQNEPPDVKKICESLWEVCPFRPDNKGNNPMTEMTTQTVPVRLSILILTMPIEARQIKLERLLNVLRPQLPADGSVEIIIKENLHVDQGGPTIGENRNEALADAQGEYVCFVDDDDLVPEYYIKEILKAIETNPDVVGLNGHYIAGQNKAVLFKHSMQYKEWITKDDILYRCPNHLNPVKRELALQAGYPAKNHGEDMDYSMKLLPLLKTEVAIEPIMYFYLKN